VRLAFATDHHGVALKRSLQEHAEAAGHTVIDLGSNSAEAVDYPDFAFALAEKVSSGGADRGILVCGTGIGMSIAANKVAGAKAALVYDAETARLSREHNDANILVLPGRKVAPEQAREWLDLWLETEFAGERHARRVNRIMDYDGKR
jgi:ribose 5-phosphate isomerase B